MQLSLFNKIFTENSPYKPRLARERNVKEDKFAKISRTLELMTTQLKSSSFRRLRFSN